MLIKQIEEKKALIANRKQNRRTANFSNVQRPVIKDGKVIQTDEEDQYRNLALNRSEQSLQLE
jgi:hypothetical protein